MVASIALLSYEGLFAKEDHALSFLGLLKFPPTDIQAQDPSVVGVLESGQPIN